MSSVPSAAELIHLGMDTSVKEIVAGVLRPGEEVPVISRIAGDEESVRRLIGLWVPKTYATRRYSWMTPPARSCRRTRI